MYCHFPSVFYVATLFLHPGTFILREHWIVHSEVSWESCCCYAISSRVPDDAAGTLCVRLLRVHLFLLLLLATHAQRGLLYLVCHSVCRSVPVVCLSVCLSVRLSACPTVYLSLRTLIWHHTQRGGQRAILAGSVGLLRGEGFHELYRSLSLFAPSESITSYSKSIRESKVTFIMAHFLTCYGMMSPTKPLLSSSYLRAHRVRVHTEWSSHAILFHRWGASYYHR